MGWSDGYHCNWLLKYGVYRTDTHICRFPVQIIATGIRKGKHGLMGKLSDKTRSDTFIKFHADPGRIFYTGNRTAGRCRGIVTKGQEAESPVTGRQNFLFTEFGDPIIKSGPEDPFLSGKPSPALSGIHPFQVKHFHFFFILSFHGTSLTIGIGF